MHKNIMVLGIMGLFIGTSILPVLGNDIDFINNSNNINLIQDVKKNNFDILTFYPTADTYVSQRSPDSNHGFDSMHEVATWDGAGSSDNWERDSFYRFNLSSIPSGVLISSAILYIYYFDYDDTNPVGRELTCYRITSSWNEDTVTWNTRPSYNSTVTSSDTVPGTWSWMNWNVTRDVQDFIDVEETNYGWQIMDEGT